MIVQKDKQDNVDSVKRITEYRSPNQIPENQETRLNQQDDKFHPPQNREILHRRGFSANTAGIMNKV